VAVALALLIAGCAPVAQSSPAETPAASRSPEQLISALYRYALGLPDGWLVITQAVAPWDGTGSPDHNGPDVDQYLGPKGTFGWAYAAPTSANLDEYVAEQSKAAAAAHPCPDTPETNESLVIGGEPARLTTMHCPADGGILVLTAYVVRNGTGFVFALQDPDGGPAAEPATKTAFEGFLANVSFGD
jgi:hypothetical protein